MHANCLRYGKFYQSQSLQLIVIMAEN